MRLTQPILAICFLSAFATTLVFTAKSQAETKFDATSGNLFLTQTDLNVPIGKTDWIFNRTYNSLSGYVGLFGKGWCTTAETTLTLQPDGCLLAVLCGQGKHLILTSDSDTSKTTKSLNEIPINAGYKNEEANLLRLKDRIELSTNVNEHYGFDLNGHLIDWSGPDNVSIKYQWLNGKLVSFSEGEVQFQVEFADNRIIALKNKDLNAVFDYKNGQLVQSVNSWDNRFTYEYDKKGHLIAVVFPDHHNILATYDQQNRVTRLLDREGCDTTLKYDSPKKRTKIKSVCVSDVPWTTPVSLPTAKATE